MNIASPSRDPRGSTRFAGGERLIGKRLRRNIRRAGCGRRGYVGSKIIAAMQAICWPRTATRCCRRYASAKLVDVRTQAEWSYVGLPDLSSLDKTVIALEWQTFPSMTVNAHFVDRLSDALKAAGARPDDPILFICRSGARSRSAAIAMTAAGWSRCYNISDGFEALDGSRHRGLVDGWKKGGLPWAPS